jgi:hypothetical protein
MTKKLDYKPAYRECLKQLKLVAAEKDRIQEKLENMEQRYITVIRIVKALRDQIKPHAEGWKKAKAELEWLTNWASETLIDPSADDPDYNTDPNKRHYCPCGCGTQIPEHKRGDSVYATEGCRDRVRKAFKYRLKKVPSGRAELDGEKNE